jgi:alkylation response protein AidB-like acyl-CoA dehydrogenase
MGSEAVLDFSFNEEQQALRQSIIKFAKNELKDDVVALDHEEKFSFDGWTKCADMGIQGLPIPQEYGGQGADILTTACGLEALGYGNRDNGLTFSINAHMWTSEIPVWMFGTEEQKRRYLPKLVSGEWVGLHAMTEPMTGSDAYSLKTRAEKKCDRYVINGTKTFISNAPIADLLIIFANLDPSKGAAGISGIIVEKGTPGMKVSRKLHKMGLRTSPMAELSLQDVEVPLENLLGKEGAGPAIFTASMEWERICIAASHVGAMQRLLETCVAYAQERQQFGQPIGSFPAIADMIAQMEVRLETSRMAVYRAAWLKREGKHPLKEIAIAKLHVSESYVKSCLDAIQIHGGYGYTTEYQIERELRDAVGGKIYSGTSEIQRLIIAGMRGL